MKYRYLVIGEALAFDDCLIDLFKFGGVAEAARRSQRWPEQLVVRRNAHPTLRAHGA